MLAGSLKKTEVVVSRGVLAVPTLIKELTLRVANRWGRPPPFGYALTIVDIYQHPEVVFSRGVLAVPTLIKELPLPVQVLIGDFTNEPRVLAALGLHAATVD